MAHILDLYMTVKIKIFSEVSMTAPFQSSTSMYWSRTDLHWTSWASSGAPLGGTGNTPPLPLFKRSQRSWGSWARLHSWEVGKPAWTTHVQPPCSFPICSLDLQRNKGSERLSDLHKITQLARSQVIQLAVQCSYSQKTMFGEKRYPWGPSEMSQVIHPQLFSTFSPWTSFIYSFISSFNYISFIFNFILSFIQQII